MYLTIQETAAYLDMPENLITKYILQGRIRALHDGESYIINKNQFTTHLEQVEKYKKIMEAYWSEPIPEDIDVKDED